jgi:hypothetical protein
MSIKPCNAFATEIRFSRIPRVIHAHARFAQIGLHRDDLQTKQREYAVSAGTVHEFTIHFEVVVVADSQYADLLVGSQLYRLSAVAKSRSASSASLTCVPIAFDPTTP